MRRRGPVGARYRRLCILLGGQGRIYGRVRYREPDGDTGYSTGQLYGDADRGRRWLGRLGGGGVDRAYWARIPTCCNSHGVTTAGATPGCDIRGGCTQSGEFVSAALGAGGPRAPSV